MKILLSIIILSFSMFLRAQEVYDTLSREALESYILNANPAQDTGVSKLPHPATVRPEFPGGYKALVKYVNDHIEFPQSMADTMKAEKIWCRTIIDRNDGKAKLQDVHSTQNKELSSKVSALLETLPSFRPGQIRGENTDFTVFLIFYFTRDTAALRTGNPYFIPVFPNNNKDRQKHIENHY